MRPVGTLECLTANLVPQITLIEVDLMLAQKREILLFEALVPVMFILSLDVRDRFVDVGFADAERAMGEDVQVCLDRGQHEIWI